LPDAYFQDLGVGRMVKMFNDLINSKVQLSLVFVLAAVAAFWRYSPLMPHVFMGDDLFYLLAFKDEQCGAVFSQLLTTACLEKFRPVGNGFILLELNLFDLAFTNYMAVNVLLQAISTTLVFVIARRLSKGSLLVAFSIAIAVVTSRFAVYQVIQVMGPVEGLALPLFLGVIYSTVRAEDRQEDALRWGWIAISLSFLLIHNHERYILITAWLAVAFVLLPNFRALPKRHFAALLLACIVVPLFNVAYKTLVLHTPFLVGTGAIPIRFNLAEVVMHFGQAVLSIIGFNEGPEYLVGARLISLPWYPAWILAPTFAFTVTIFIAMGIRGAFEKQHKQLSAPFWSSVRWPILLWLLALLLLIPAISTIRLEQRWIFAPFILLLLVIAWAVGQWESKTKAVFWPLIIILSASSTLLDSLVVKHFDQMYLVYAARFADMVKRDIADKYPGQSSGIILVDNLQNCVWSLQNGKFFRIYGGRAREVKCVSGSPDEAFDGAGMLVFAEKPLGHLSNLTNEWHAWVNALRERRAGSFTQ
jgi:hypothetical protein